MKLRIMLLAVLLPVQAFAGLLFNYSQLALKDLDQMSQLVRGKIEESRKTRGDKSIPLKEALQAVFSRPNEDGLIEKILSPLKNELEDRDVWESSIEGLIKESIGALKNPRGFKPVVQTTYWIFLENLVSELKPHADRKFEQKILSKIRDAKISIPSEAKHERSLRMMKEGINPSEAADKILVALASKKEE